MDIEKEDSILIKLLSTIDRCKEVFECNELTTIEDILNKAMDEIQTLRAKVASAEVLVEALSTIRHNAYMDSSTNKTVIEIYEVADKAIMTYDKLSEVKHDTK